MSNLVGPASDHRRRAPWHAWARLALALAGTALLTLGWGRTLILTMFLGAPEPLVAGITLGVLLAVLAATWGLRARFTDQPTWSRFDGGFIAGLLLLWCGVYAALFLLYLTAFVPLWQIYLVFVPSTVWVLFAGWLGWWPGTMRLKLGLLMMLLLLAVDFPLLVEVTGLDGSGAVNLDWRGQNQPPMGARVEARRDFAGAKPAPTARRFAALGPNDFPRFLGPQGNAMLPLAKIAGDWQATPPKLLWRVPVGEGWSSFAIAGELCFTQEQQDNRECVVCRDLLSGSEVWRHGDPVRFGASLGGPGPRATPTVADGKIYAVGATGLLNCLEAATGKSLWRIDLLADNQVPRNLEHGVCGSPLVHAGRVYVSPPGEDGKSLVAYDAVTGRRLWQAGAHRASYSSPQWVELLGTPQILVFHADGVAAHAVADGKELWRHPWRNHVRVNVSQPLVIRAEDGAADVLLSTGYDTGSTLVRVTRTPTGDWSVTKVWEARRLRTKFTTAVLYADHVYGLDDGILCCLDPRTGQQLWKAGRYNHGQVLLAGDRLIVQAEDGAVVLVEPSPKALIERGRIAALAGKTWNHPALAGRHLLVRNDREAACFVLP